MYPRPTKERLLATGVVVSGLYFQRGERRKGIHFLGVIVEEVSK